MQVFLVGGAVRDNLLNIAVKDRDWLVVGSTPEEMLSQGYQQVGKDFPVFLHPKTKEEYALARTEQKQGNGYTGFICDFSQAISLEDDLARRDLTINAIALDQEDQLHDPYNGVKDLNDKILRHVSPAFAEDPLRVLRVARFAAKLNYLGFKIADDTLDLMRLISVGEELDCLTPERVWIETEKALNTPNPEVYFKILHDIGALKIIMPELDRLWGVPNPKLWHPEIDTGIHTMMVLAQSSQLSGSSVLRFAALCHDLGKGLTPQECWPSHHGHEKAGINVINSMCKRLKVPNQYRELAVLVSEFHCHFHKAFELRAETWLKVFDRCDLWRKPDRFEQIMLASYADFKGRKDFENKTYPQLDYVKELVVETQKITAKEFVQQGLKGLEIKAAITQKRLESIDKIKAKFH